jgi:predicted GNAT family acetyltransferase
MRDHAMAANTAQSSLTTVPPSVPPRRPMTSTIEHLPQRHCFQTTVDGQRCTVDYDLTGSVLTITHTFVPLALEGRGIAGRMTEAVLEHARSRQLKVRPLCSYARAYMRRHPDTLDLIA